MFGPGQLDVGCSVLQTVRRSSPSWGAQSIPQPREIMVPGWEAGVKVCSQHWEVGFLSPVPGQNFYHSGTGSLSLGALPSWPLCGQNFCSLSQQNKAGSVGEVLDQRIARPWVCFHPCSSVSVPSGPDQDAFFNVIVIAQVLMQIDSQRPLISSAQNPSQIFLMRECEGHITILPQEILTKS